MAATFGGFPRETLQFLKTLKRNNARDWFQENKARYESAFLLPSLDFIAAMEQPLLKISPCFQAIAKKQGGSLMRIYKDTRFAKDKTPYKTNIGIHFRHEAGCSVHAPGFYVHVEPGNCFVGAGIWRPDKQPLFQIRTAISETPPEWKRARDAKSFRATFDLSGNSLKRPPAGFDNESPMMEDLKRKDFIGVCHFNDDELTDPKFLQDVTKKFKAATPFMRFLCHSLELPF
ncbi:MAG: DUF2461 domain-containing protein [Rhodopirellula sp.]|nr:DUF2461 domain-containing protein [Rhodopirellula sp.]